MLENINERLTAIENRLDHIDKKQPKKLKYNVLQVWKEKIRDNCQYLEKVGIEGEAEYFCKKTNDVCNMLSCPLNQEDYKDEKSD